MSETLERRLYLDLQARLEAGQPVALATIVRVWGSSPREVGAKMMVGSDGEIAGTVGGGCGEAEVWQEAREALRDGKVRTVHVDLTEDVDSESGKVCGGRLDVFVDLWRPEMEEARRLARALEVALRGGEEMALATVLGPTRPPHWKRGAAEPSAEEDPLSGTRLAVLGEGRMQGTVGEGEADTRILNLALRALSAGRAGVETVEIGGLSYDVYLEPLPSPPSLVIAGAGHIARPLCTMAALCGYAVTVVDDRPDYADAGFFPGAARVVCRPFQEAFAELPAGPSVHVVLVTRGHRHDEDCLRMVAGKRLGYVGMIGSRRRTRAVFADLEAEGVDPAWLDRVHAPIGLDIGAETPEEIAVCILAEIIKVRRGGSAPSLSLRGR